MFYFCLLLHHRDAFLFGTISKIQPQIPSLEIVADVLRFLQGFFSPIKWNIIVSCSIRTPEFMQMMLSWHHAQKEEKKILSLLIGTFPFGWDFTPPVALPVLSWFNRLTLLQVSLCSLFFAMANLISTISRTVTQENFILFILFIGKMDFLGPNSVTFSRVKYVQMSLSYL